MITKEEYADAVEQKTAAEHIINQYHREQADAFEKRLHSGVPFTDDELIYSAFDLCPCGHGIAYPKGCGITHYWECAGILKGITDAGVQHCDRLPFAFYSVISEQQTIRANGRTTRGVFKPKEVKP
jgi:hypothetical protein